MKRDRRPLAVLFRSPLFLLACVSLACSFVSVVNARDYDIFLAQSLRRVNNFVLFILITTIVDSQKVIRRIFWPCCSRTSSSACSFSTRSPLAKSILTTVWGENQKDIALEYT